MIENPTTDTSLRWVVAHTKPRCEKKFAQLLQRVTLEHTLALFESTRRYGGRAPRKSLVPVFPGYVFVHLEADKRPRLFEQDLLVRLIPITDQGSFFKQLQAIRLALEAGLLVKPEPRLSTGTRVKITGGPLYGVEGVVTDPANPEQVLLAVDVLQQGLLVKIDRQLLEVL